MKTAREISAKIGSLRDELDSIIVSAEKAERDLSVSETTRVRAICDSEIPHLHDQLEAVAAVEKDRHSRAAAKLGPELDRQMALDGFYAPSNASAWQRDERGRGFAILNKSQKASDIFKPQCENEFGHFVLAKIFGAGRSTPQSVRAALTSSDNTLGGFLVPERLSGEVIDLARAKSVLMAAGTRTVIMDSDNLTIPKLESDVTIATKAENAAFTESNVTFGARRLDTYTAGALTKISRELWEDAPGLLAEQLEGWLAAAMATKVDAWGLVGTGSAQPVGIITRADLSGPGSIESTGAIGAIAWEDISAAALEVRKDNHEPQAVILSPTNLHALLESVTGDATNSTKNWLMEPPTISGKSMLPTTNCPDAKAIVGDFSKYLMGIRTGAQVEASTVAGDAMERHQVWVKITMRFDFCTLDDSAFHILTGITV